MYYVSSNDWGCETVFEVRPLLRSFPMSRPPLGYISIRLNTPTPQWVGKTPSRLHFSPVRIVVHSWAFSDRGLNVNCRLHKFRTQPLEHRWSKTDNLVSPRCDDGVVEMIDSRRHLSRGQPVTLLHLNILKRPTSYPWEVDDHKGSVITGVTTAMVCAPFTPFARRSGYGFARQHSVSASRIMNIYCFGGCVT